MKFHSKGAESCSCFRMGLFKLFRKLQGQRIFFSVMRLPPPVQNDRHAVELATRTSRRSRYQVAAAVQGRVYQKGTEKDTAADNIGKQSRHDHCLKKSMAAKMHQEIRTPDTGEKQNTKPRLFL
mmetsp:Transcript_7176/g.10984  ORF Transcript_7176/g.10984 Transcript_7176/m.10984 type:complete len:124 (-) Transcript_7176:20-391(-)